VLTGGKRGDRSRFVQVSRQAEIDGVYFGIEGRDANPYGPNYEDFRLMLIYTKRFASPR